MNQPISTINQSPKLLNSREAATLIGLSVEDHPVLHPKEAERSALTGTGSKKTYSGTITEKVPRRPPRISPQTPSKVGFNDPEGTITVDAIEVHAAEIPRRFRGQYRAVKSGNSRKAAIRVQCLECMGWNPKEVKTCTAPQCPLYKWRIKG